MSALTPAVKAAIDWLVLLDSGIGKTTDRASFEAWLGACAEHRQAWEAVNGALTRQLQPLAQMRDEVPGGAQLTGHLLRASGIPLTRRRLLRGTSALLLLAGLPAVLGLQRRMPLEGLFSDAYTGTAERKRIHLQDNSLLTLNARTCIDIDVGSGHRQVRLHQGELCAEVALAATPFEVLCTEARVSSSSGCFIVARQSGQMQVTVERGSAQVHTAQGERVNLDKGQGLRLEQGQVTTWADLPQRSGAWLEGLVDVRDESLGAVIDSLRPYCFELLRLSPEAARLRVFGVFSLDNSKQALQSLAQVLPIRVAHYGPLLTIDRA